MSNPGETVAEFPQLEFPTRRVTVNIVATYVVESPLRAEMLRIKMEEVTKLFQDSGAEFRLEYQTN